MTRSVHAHSIPRASGAAASGGGNHLTPAGTLIPEADLRTLQIARQARSWRAFAGDRSRMQPETLDTKAFDACAFSVHHRASSFAVPSKLVGTSRHQPFLQSISEDPNTAWLALDLDARGDHLVVSYGGRVLGRVQPKHLGWIRPLVPFGLAVYVSRITGTDNRHSGYRLGCNVVFGHVGEALARLADATRGGDGASGAPSVDGRSPLRLVVPSESRAQAVRTPVGIPIRPEHEALAGDPEDVVLWRTLEGEAHASIPHATRHSPTGIEWGYGGSGPADLARSILLALVDEPTADALYQRFKQDVVATVPKTGGVLRAADVRAWVERAQYGTR